MSERMTKSDRDALIRIVKGRARQARTEADQRAAVLQAEIEQEITAEYSARDEMWAEAVQIAEQAMAKANVEIKARAAELGVPTQHAPGLTMGWRSRSPSYADKERRAELRKLAERRVAALTKTAKMEIDAKSLDAEEALLVGGLESDEARAVVESLPAVERLMPALTLDSLAVGRWAPPEGAAHELMAPVTTTDRKRRQVLRAIEANPGASNRAIAGIVAVDHKTVAKYRAERGEIPSDTGEIPTDRDGGGRDG